jgi:hypothetical protein
MLARKKNLGVDAVRKNVSRKANVNLNVRCSRAAVIQVRPSIRQIKQRKSQAPVAMI